MVEGAGLTRIPASAEGLGDLELYGEDGASLGTVKNILHQNLIFLLQSELSVVS
jgi:hypothetical protein